MIPIGPVIARARVAAAREEVWAWITDLSRRERWLPGLTLGEGLSGEVQVIADHSASGEALSGNIDVWVAGHALGWHWAADEAAQTAPLVTLRSNAEGTLVTLTETGFDALENGAEAAQAAQTLWQDALDKLRELAAVSETEAAPEPALEAEPESAFEPAPETAPEPESAPAAEPEVEAERAAEPEPEPEPQPEPEAEAEPEPELEIEPEPELEPEPEPEPEPEAAPEPVLEAVVLPEPPADWYEREDPSITDSTVVIPRHKSDADADDAEQPEQDEFLQLLQDASEAPAEEEEPRRRPWWRRRG